jgi:hypothetical protein
MHIIHAIHSRTCRAALAAAMCVFPLLAACGRGDAETTNGDAAAADTAAADTVAADTSAMAVARRVLGPQVRMAIPFHMPHRGARFIAAALPVMDWVPDPARSGNSVAPGGHELVIVEVTPESQAVHKPGLYASREPYLPRLDDTATAVPADSATLARTMGVEDVDGDGNPEVWAAQYSATRGDGHTWDLRAYDRNGRTMYQVLATYASAGGTQAAARNFSGEVGRNPPVRQWLTARVDALEAALAASPAGAAR